MPRGAAAHEAFTVGKILNEAQRSVAGHKKCAAALWRLAARDMAGTLRQLCDCLRHVLQIGQVRPLLPDSWQRRAKHARCLVLTVARKAIQSTPRNHTLSPQHLQWASPQSLKHPHRFQHVPQLPST